MQFDNGVFMNVDEFFFFFFAGEVPGFDQQRATQHKLGDRVLPPRDYKVFMIWENSYNLAAASSVVKWNPARRRGILKAYIFRRTGG